jgi:hypothetical protein
MCLRPDSAAQWPVTKWHGCRKRQTETRQNEAQKKAKISTLFIATKNQSGNNNAVLSVLIY